jgi:hypothetical protein
MALTPLDLQTLFIKMNEVNSEQAHLRGAEAQEQAFEAKRLAEQEIQKDSSVNPMGNEQEMDNRIKDEQERKGHDENRKDGNRGDKKKDGEESDPEKMEYITDPNLGQNIDLIG